MFIPGTSLTWTTWARLTMSCARIIFQRNSRRRAKPNRKQVLNIVQFYHRKIKVHVCIIRPWLKYFQLNLTLHKFPPALFLAWIFLSRFQEHSTPSLAYREWTHRRTEGRPCSRSSPQVLEKRNNACSSKNILLHSLLGWGGSGKKPKTVRKKPPSKPVF